MEENNKNELLINDQRNLDSINKIPDECLCLMPDENKREKQRLINVFDKLKDELDRNKGNKITDAYKVYSEDENDKTFVIKNSNRCIFWFMVIVIFPLFSITNLVGIFLIISIKDILFKLLKSSLKCKLEIFCNIEEFEKQSQFFDYFLQEANKEPLNFNLIMFWSFVGIKCLSSCGFRKTTIAFLILNTLMILLIYVIDFSSIDPITKKYSYPKIIIIFLLWLFMGFTFGSSTLLSQQILTNYYSLLFSGTENNNDGKEIKEMKEKEEENEEKKEEKEEENEEENEKKEEKEILDKLKEKSNEMNVNYEKFRKKRFKKFIKSNIKRINN